MIRFSFTGHMPSALWERILQAICYFKVGLESPQSQDSLQLFMTQSRERGDHFQMNGCGRNFIKCIKNERKKDDCLLHMFYVLDNAMQHMI